MEVSSQKENEENFQIKSNKNKLFNLTIKYNANSLTISCIYKENITIEEYEEIFTLEKIRKIKYFLIYDSLKEIYEEILFLMKAKQNEIKINEDANKIILILPLQSLKFREIEIYVEKKMKSEKEISKDLYSIISDLKKENNELKTNQEYLIKRINQLENDVKYLKECIKKEEIKKEEIKIDSIIINNNENYYSSLKKWIDKPKIQFELLYRLSRDGKEYETFHRLCDNKGNTLLIVKLQDGNILGGFTTQNWDNSNRWKSDKHSFVFSLTKNLKCKNKNNNDSIYCGHDNRGPCFGNFLYFYQNKMDVVGINSKDNCYFLECNKLHNGISQYDTNKVEEVEIFKVII